MRKRSVLKMSSGHKKNESLLTASVPNTSLTIMAAMIISQFGRLCTDTESTLNDANLPFYCLEMMMMMGCEETITSELPAANNL